MTQQEQVQALVDSEVDVNVQNEGSIVLVRPLSDAAKAWVDEHIPNDAQWFGNAFAVEPRYLDEIVFGMEQDGLNVQ